MKKKSSKTSIFPSAEKLINQRNNSQMINKRPSRDSEERSPTTRTRAVAVCGRLRDGAGQGPAARLGWELGEFLHVICKLDLLKDTKQEELPAQIHWKHHHPFCSITGPCCSTGSYITDQSPASWLMGLTTRLHKEPELQFHPLLLCSMILFPLVISSIR